MSKNVTREQFDAACEAVWPEIEYQNSLPRRQDREVTDIPGFASLSRVYLRRMEDSWATRDTADGARVVLRKLAAIFLRAIAYGA